MRYALTFFLLLSSVSVFGNEFNNFNVSDFLAEKVKKNDVEYRGSSFFKKCNGGRLWGGFYRVEPSYRGNDIYFTTPKSYGAFVGYDRKYRGKSSLSIYYNYGYTDSISTADFDSNVSTHLLGLKYRKTISKFYLQFAGSAGYDDYAYDLHTPANRLEGNGYQARGYAEIGMSLSVSGFDVKPFAACQYDWLQRNEIDITMPKENYDGYEGIFGARLEYSAGGFKVEARAAWIHNFKEDADPILSLSYSSLPASQTPTQLFYDGDIGNDWVWLGVGGHYTIMGKFLLFLDYDLTHNSNKTFHIASAGLAINW